MPTGENLTERVKNKSDLARATHAMALQWIVSSGRRQGGALYSTPDSVVFFRHTDSNPKRRTLNERSRNEGKTCG